MIVLIDFHATYNNGVMAVLFLSLVSLIRMAFICIVMLSLGMGLDAPWGRVISPRYAIKTKGLQKCQKRYMWTLSIQRKHVLLS